MFKYFISLIICGFMLTVEILAQQKFPALECENLEGNTKAVPSSENKRNQLVIIAFGKKNEKELESWIQPVYDKFIAKAGLLDLFFDAEVSLISVLNAIESAAAKANKEKLKKEIDPELQPYMWILKSSDSELLTSLNIQSRDLHLFLLNPGGEIIYQTTGKYAESKMDKIEDALDD